MTEHEPSSAGEPDSVNEYNRDTETTYQMARMYNDVAEHGEVHARLNGRDDEVEVRLGTTRFNFDGGLIEVWDGDEYVPFDVTHIESWYKPYDVYH